MPLSPDAGKLAYIKSAENPFYPLATATLQTTVFDVVHMFSELGISAVPIVDDQGRVINLYETVDVIVSLVKHSRLIRRRSFAWELTTLWI